MRPRNLLPLMLILFIFACSDNFSPTSPSTNTYSGTDKPPQDDRITSNWSPYIGVSPTGEAHEAYRISFAQLKNKGRLKGIRMGLDDREPAKIVASMAVQNGLDILGLISVNTTLNPKRNPDIEGTLADFYKYFPEIRTFQIGNEVTIAPHVNPTPLTLDEYVAIWRRVWTFTRKNYPDKILLTQSTHSAFDLEKMIDMGMLEVEGANINNLIVSMNCYTTDIAGYYGDVVRSKVGNYRTWVTESGYQDWNRHKYQVESVYPVIKAQIRPERTYFYQYFAGKIGKHAEFGLIKEPDVFPLKGSPLYEHLLGR